MNDLLDAALGYGERGWPVLPLAPLGKIPAGELVPHGLKDATTDPGVIRQWWARLPQANIGLRTGVCFDALDVDAPGWPTLARIVDEHGPLTLGPVSMTGGGGAHDLFLPTGAGNRAGFAPGLDWRGANGYIVAPPSVHSNGNQYEWAIPPDDGEFPLCAAPPWLIHLILPRPVPIAFAPILRPSSARPYGRAAVKRECEKVATAPEGQRNHTLNLAAFNLAQLVAAGILDADETADALLAAAACAGLGGGESRKTLASGFKAGLAQPRQMAS